MVFAYKLVWLTYLTDFNVKLMCVFRLFKRTRITGLLIGHFFAHNHNTSKGRYIHLNVMQTLGVGSTGCNYQ